MKVEIFDRRRDRGPSARIENGPDVFVKYAGRWEWYRTDAKGYRGLEKFMGFVDDSLHAVVLDKAFGLGPGSRWYELSKRLIPRERTYRLVGDDFDVLDRPRVELADLRRSL